MTPVCMYINSIELVPRFGLLPPRKKDTERISHEARPLHQVRAGTWVAAPVTHVSIATSWIVTSLQCRHIIAMIVRSYAHAHARPILLSFPGRGLCLRYGTRKTDWNSVTLSPETDKMTDTAKIARILQDTDEIHNICRAILATAIFCAAALVRQSVRASALSPVPSDDESRVHTLEPPMCDKTDQYIIHLVANTLSNLASFCFLCVCASALSFISSSSFVSLWAWRQRRWRTNLRPWCPYLIRQRL